MHIKPFIVLAGILVLLNVGACRAPRSIDESPAGPRAEIRAMMDRYLADFNDRNYAGIADMWQVPGWIARGDVNQLLEDEAAVEQFFRALLASIGKDGYDHSELLSMEITVFNPSCAFVRITFTRWTTDGAFMPPRVRSGSYFLLKNDGRWGVNSIIVPGNANVIPEAVDGQEAGGVE